MTPRLAVSDERLLVADSMAVFGKSGMVMWVLVLAWTVPLIAQSSELQRKLAGVEQAMAANKQSLQRYQWTETTQLTLKGDAKPPSQNVCQYASGGQVQKTPMTPPPPPPSGGRLKQRVIANKKGEMQDYMGDVKNLVALYLPPDPQKMEQANQAGEASLNPAGGMVNLVFRDYAQPGDQMTLTFNTGTKKIASLSVDAYMGQSKDAVTLQVQMANLPDGTNYVQQTVLKAAANQLVVTTTNSNYQTLGG
jgi:hypothetical protein